MKHKIYIFNNGTNFFGESAVAIADDGHVLAGHACSNESFMRKDMGMDGSNWKHEHYNAYFGEGNWELEWVPTEMVDAKSHEGLQAAFAAHDALPKAEQEPQNQPRIEIGVSP